MEEVKSCPFCGSKAILYKDNFNKVTIICNQCGVKLGIELEDGVELKNGWKATYNSAKEAIGAWNRRYEPPNEPLTLDELLQMDGEPVWVVEPNDYPLRWGLVYLYRKDQRNIVNVTINNGVMIRAEEFIRNDGKIYRRKAEGQEVKAK